MKIKSIFILTLTMLLALPALADKASMNFLYLTGRLETAEGMEHISVSVVEDGKLKIQGSGATRIVAEPTVIEDALPVDGPLALKVGAAKLYVGSGFTIDGTISYTLELAGKMVELKPVVNLTLSK